MNFKDILKIALAAKNKQIHRIIGGTKQARRLQSQYSSKFTLTKEQADARDTARKILREQSGTIKRTYSKTDLE
jgi:hypothetical protein